MIPLGENSELPQIRYALTKMARATFFKALRIIGASYLLWDVVTVVQLEFRGTEKKVNMGP